MKTDLHLHTNFSDGELSPQKIVDVMLQKGADVIAITDHDEIGGACVAKNYAQGKHIKIICGLELSAEHEGESVHVLGYNVDTYSPQLKSFLEEQKHNRHKRNNEIIQRLSGLGIELNYSEIVENAGKTVGRVHIAKALVDKGICESVSQAFELYLCETGMAYARGTKPSVSQAICVIHQSGGKAVIAHPCKIKLNETQIEQLIYRAKEWGARGIEAAYFAQTKAQVEFFTAVAQKYGMFITGGSDFHSYKAASLGSKFFLPNKSTIQALRLEDKE